MSLNLSSQPFVNSRPVRRLVFVLWCLGLLLLGANVFFYSRHLSGQQERLGRLDALIEQETVERERLTELEAELAGFDVDWQRRQVEFLNLRIAERVFPWSRLFDRLTEAMPRQVRLTRLRPSIESLSGGAGGPEEKVALEIRAEARDEEAILEFVGQLFEHAAFRDPNLSSEDRRPRAKVTEFSLSATYLPGRAGEDPAAAAAPAAAGPEIATPAAVDDGTATEADGQEDEPAAGDEGPDDEEEGEE